MLACAVAVAGWSFGSQPESTDAPDPRHQCPAGLLENQYERSNPIKLSREASDHLSMPFKAVSCDLKALFCSVQGLENDSLCVIHALAWPQNSSW